MNNTKTITKDKIITKVKAKDETITKANTITKDNTITKVNTITKDNPITEAKTKANFEDNIYTRIRYESKECTETFRSNVALTAYTFSDYTLYLEENRSL